MVVDWDRPHGHSRRRRWLLRPYSPDNHPGAEGGDLRAPPSRPRFRCTRASARAACARGGSVCAGTIPRAGCDACTGRCLLASARGTGCTPRGPVGICARRARQHPALHASPSGGVRTGRGRRADTFPRAGCGVGTGWCLPASACSTGRTPRVPAGTCARCARHRWLCPRHHRSACAPGGSVCAGMCSAQAEPLQHK